MKNKIINPYTFFKNTQLMPSVRPTQALTVATKPINNLTSTSPILKLAKESLKIGSNLPGYLGLGFTLANLFLNKNKENNGEKPTESRIQEAPKTIAEAANSQNNSLAN